MKKFKYKLEALLKLRKFKESQLKVELGAINREILQTKENITQLEKNIQVTYDDQEKILASPTSGQMAQFYPQFIQERREEIKNKENLIYSLNKKYEKKLKELSLAIGETKVIQKMKEKDLSNFMKEQMKKESQNIEELYLMTKQYGNDL